VVEQPQQVQYFLGQIIAINPATLEFGYQPGIAARPGIGPWLVGLHGVANGPAGALRVSGGFVDVYLEASTPSMVSREYTVLLDSGTPVIVVQNDYPDRYPDAGGVGTPVVARVVGHSARVMAQTTLPPGMAQRLASRGPLLPLGGAAPAAPDGGGMLLNQYRPTFVVSY